MPTAGKNSIHILRGANVKTNSSIATLTLSNGQPLYDTQTGYLYIGEGNTIANTAAVKASYADNANSANLATYATGLTSTLSINSGGTGGTNARTAMKNLMMNVDTSTNPGNSEYLVFATSTTAYRYNYGYIKNDILSEVSTSSVTNANYANFAGTAYKVSGPNVQGAVNSANFATTAGKVSHSFKLNVNGTSYIYNGSNVDIDVLNDNPVVTLSKTTAKGAIVYTNATGRINWLSHPGVSGRVLTSGSSGSIFWSTPTGADTSDTISYFGRVDAGTYSFSNARFVAFCTYGSAPLKVQTQSTQSSGFSNVATLYGPMAIIDATRGSDSSATGWNGSGTYSFQRFNAASYSKRFQTPAGTRWLIYRMGS